MRLTVRHPKFDFSQVLPHWSPNVAFAHLYNATSIVPASIEPWLIKVMQSALERIPQAESQLREDVSLFIGQESQHFRQHRKFNKTIVANGYPGVADWSDRLSADLDGFLRNRSLKFQLAYAEGFEASGAIQGEFWFSAVKQLLEGSDPRAVALWKWHMAEEFEHREVCFQVYKSLYGRGPIRAIVNGYFYRIYGLIYATLHLNGYISAMKRYLIAQDRQKMVGNRARFVKREDRKVMKVVNRFFFPRLLRNLWPWYDPAKIKPPRELQVYLRDYRDARTAT